MFCFTGDEVEGGTELTVFRKRQHFGLKKLN